MNSFKKTLTKEEYFIVKNEAYKKAEEFYKIENKERKEKYIKDNCPIKDSKEAELIFKNTLLIPDDKAFLRDTKDIKNVLVNLKEKYKLPESTIIIKYMELNDYGYEDLLNEKTFYELDLSNCKESNIINIKNEELKELNLDLIEKLWPEYDLTSDDEEKSR